VCLNVNLGSTNNSLLTSRCLFDIAILALVRLAFGFAAAASVGALVSFVLSVKFVWPATGVAKTSVLLGWTQTCYLATSVNEFPDRFSVCTGILVIAVATGTRATGLAMVHLKSSNKIRNFCNNMGTELES